MEAVQDAGYLGHAPPQELVYAQMCETYHCLPSQLMEEPADELFRNWQVARAYDNWLAKRPKHIR